MTESEKMLEGELYDCGGDVTTGGGSVVTKSILDNKAAYGNPCRVIRDNN